KNTIQNLLKEATIVRRVVLIAILFMTLLIVLGGFSTYVYLTSAIGPMEKQSDETIDVEIPLGSSTADIAQILHDEGLIKNKTVFRFYIKFKNYASIQAGDYALSPAMGLGEILDELQHGKVMEEPLFRVTIPEGKTIEEIAVILSKALEFSEEDFLEIVNDPSFVQSMKKSY